MVYLLYVGSLGRLVNGSEEIRSEPFTRTAHRLDEYIHAPTHALTHPSIHGPIDLSIC